MKKLILLFTLITSVALSHEAPPEEREKNLVWLQKMRGNIESLYRQELKKPECQHSKLRPLIAKDDRDQALKRIDKFVEINVHLFYKKN